MIVRKKPIELEACLWTGGNHREMINFLEPDGANKHLQPSGDHFCIDHNRVEGGLVIKTLNGEVVVYPGDYVLKGTADEYWPVNAEVFPDSYVIIHP